MWSKSGDLTLPRSTIAIVASLETLLNLEAVDKLDPNATKLATEPRTGRPGCRQHVAGLIGGLPMTA